VHAFLPAKSAPSLAGRGAGSDLVVGAPVDSAAAGAASREPDGAAAPREYADPLHEELYACTEVAEVLDIVEDEASTGLSAKHVCKLLVRAAALARRRDGGGPEEQRALVEHPMFALLLTLAEERAASFSAKVPARTPPFGTGAWRAAPRRRAPDGRQLTRALRFRQEVAQVLHALATLRQRPVPLLQALSAEAAGKAPGANAQDVATGIWALGTLRYLSRTALDAYTSRMLELLPTFDPQVRPHAQPERAASLSSSWAAPVWSGSATHRHVQITNHAHAAAACAGGPQPPSSRPPAQGLSMIAYGFAQLEHAPEGDALERLCAAAAARLPEFRSQAASNLLYALARLQHYPHGLCAAAEEHAAACIVGYRPQARPTFHPALADMRPSLRARSG